MGARERFAEWVKSMTSQQSAADALSKHIDGGCSRSTVTKIVDGIRRPGLEFAFAIEAATHGWSGGQILASEWSRSTTDQPTPVRKTGTEG